MHRVRAARETGDDESINALLPMLLSRCGPHLRTREGAGVDHIQLRKEILARFSALFAFSPGSEASQRLDYFEADFSGAFATLRIDTYRWERRRTAAAKPPPGDNEGERVDAELGGAHEVQEALRSAIVREHVAAVDSLPSDEREAWILVYRLGLKVESLDPSEETAAKLLHVTGKTIRNRLAKARVKLGVEEGT